MFNFLSSLSTKAFIIIAGVAIVFCSLATWYTAQRYYEKEMAAYVLEVTSAKVKEDTMRLTQTVTSLHRLDADNKASKQKHENTKKKLDAAYSELRTLRLSIPTDLSTNDSCSGCPAGDNESLAGIWLLPEAVERDISALSREADAILEQARICQEFGQSLIATKESLNGIR